MIDNEDHNAVEPTTNMALQANIMEQEGVQAEDTDALVTNMLQGKGVSILIFLQRRLRRQ
jgi:hypothetical protein